METNKSQQKLNCDENYALKENAYDFNDTLKVSDI